MDQAMKWKVHWTNRLNAAARRSNITCDGGPLTQYFGINKHLIVEKRQTRNSRTNSCLIIFETMWAYLAICETLGYSYRRHYVYKTGRSTRFTGSINIEIRRMTSSFSSSDTWRSAPGLWNSFSPDENLTVLGFPMWVATMALACRGAGDRSFLKKGELGDDLYKRAREWRNHAG